MTLMASMKTAAERLQSAKLAIKRTERRLDEANERRRAILREHDANGTAAIRADDEIAALRLLRLRLIDQVDLLPSQVQREASEVANPSTAAACWEFVAGMEVRVAQLRAAKRAGAVSAGVDDELDKTVFRISEMRKRAAYLERFEVSERKGDAA
jgi:hypothetical protein